jgi:hypothetical protein
MCLKKGCFDDNNNNNNNEYIIQQNNNERLLFHLYNSSISLLSKKPVLCRVSAASSCILLRLPPSSTWIISDIPFRCHAWYGIVPFASWFINAFSDILVPNRHLTSWLPTCSSLVSPPFLLNSSFHLAYSPSLSFPLTQSACTNDMDSFNNASWETSTGGRLGNEL